MKEIRFRRLLAAMIVFMPCILSASSTPVPDDHPCSPQGEPPDECHVWEDCQWKSTCAEGEVCCGGSCEKVDSCNVCCGGEIIDICIEESAGLSLSADGFSKITAILEKAPMISSASISLNVAGDIKRRNCCENEIRGKVYTGEGSFTAGLSVGLNLPGLKNKFRVPAWEGVYNIWGEYSLGPTVTVTSSGKGTTGYEKDECADTECKTGAGSASVGLDVKYGGKVSLNIQTLLSPETYIVGGEISAGGETSVSANIDWSIGTCDEKLTSKVCWGGLTASGALTAEISGALSFNYSISKELLKGGCYPKEKEG